MPSKSADAILLRAFDVGEADQILVFFTHSDGKLRGIAHSSRKSRRRFGGSLQPLSHVCVRYFEREGRDLARIDECELLHSYFKAQQDLRTSGYLFYLAELVEEFCREKQPEERFYRLLLASLEAVERGADPGWVARYFELWTLRLHGLLPDLCQCARCDRPLSGTARYAAHERGLLCSRCAAESSGPVVAAEVVRHLRELSRLPPGSAGGEPMLLGPCESFLQLLLTDFTERPFRSLQVLREMGVR
ncbi:MAG: DNA repair protein RecO [Acidobacteriota bacterium]